MRKVKVLLVILVLNSLFILAGNTIDLKFPKMDNGFKVVKTIGLEDGGFLMLQSSWKTIRKAKIARFDSEFNLLFESQEVEICKASGRSKWDGNGYVRPYYGEIDFFTVNKQVMLIYYANSASPTVNCEVYETEKLSLKRKFKLFDNHKNLGSFYAFQKNNKIGVIIQNLGKGNLTEKVTIFDFEFNISKQITNEVSHAQFVAYKNNLLFSTNGDMYKIYYTFDKKGETRKYFLRNISINKDYPIPSCDKMFRAEIRENSYSEEILITGFKIDHKNIIGLKDDEAGRFSYIGATEVYITHFKNEIFSPTKVVEVKENLSAKTIIKDIFFLNKDSYILLTIGSSSYSYVANNFHATRGEVSCFKFTKDELDYNEKLDIRQHIAESSTSLYKAQEIVGYKAFEKDGDLYFFYNRINDNSKRMGEGTTWTQSISLYDQNVEFSLLKLSLSSGEKNLIPIIEGFSSKFDLVIPSNGIMWGNDQIIFQRCGEGEARSGGFVKVTY